MKMCVGKKSWWKSKNIQQVYELFKGKSGSNFCDWIKVPTTSPSPLNISQ